MNVLKVPRGTVAKYGLLFPPLADGRPMPELDIEFACFLRGGTKQTSKYDHCARIFGMLWPHVELNRWLERELRAFCENRFTGLTGCANSGKSFGMAAWGLLNWWADPLHTLVIILSTNKVDARRRIWAHVVRLFREARLPMPGKVIGSIDMIALREMKKEEELGSDASAIILIAGGESDALDRLQGMKNDRVIDLCDEGQSVHPAIMDAMFNHKSNPYFEFRMAGNPSQPFDPHGSFCEPISALGGHSLDYENLDEWPILALGMYEGTAIHFNNLDSPNFDRQREGLPLLPFLPMPDDVMATRRALGPDDPRLWRQSIGVWSKGSSVRQTVFTDAELNKFKVREGADFITSERGFGIDPAYTEFGDQFIVRPFDWGRCADGVSRLRFHPPIAIPDAPYDEGGVIYRGPFARAKRVRDLAKEYGVPARLVGVDDTGRNPIKAILDSELGGVTLGVGFGDNASDEIPVNLVDDTVGRDVYINKGTEMWYSLREFAEHDQLRGLSDVETLRQLAGRKFIMRARGRVMLESKKDYKARVGGKSPDETDAAAVGTAVARERMGAIPGLKVIQERRQEWSAQIRKVSVPPQRLQTSGGLSRLTF